MFCDLDEYLVLLSRSYEYYVRGIIYYEVFHMTQKRQKT